MALNIWKQMIVDRIHMNIAIKEDIKYKFSWGRLHVVYDERKILLPKGKMTKCQGLYSLRIGYFPAKNRKIADIEVGQRNKYRYFKLSLYPSKFIGTEFADLKTLLVNVLPDFDYQTLYFHSRVSYLELACDSLTHPIDSFIPFCQKVNISEVFPKGDPKGSTYIGSKASNFRFCIYDKAKQLADTKQLSPHKLHTRLEARVRKTNFAPAELLASLPNCFEKLSIADRKIACALSKDPEWTTFLHTCREVGSPKVLATLKKGQRKIFMDRLSAARVTWWRPEMRWKGLSDALQMIAP